MLNMENMLNLKSGNKSIICVIASIILSSCATQQETSSSSSVLAGKSLDVVASSNNDNHNKAANRSVDNEYNAKPSIYGGTDTFIAPENPHFASGLIENQEGEITLNFYNTDIREVLKATLGDFLKLNFSIDPAVKGTISVHTSSPLSKTALLSVLETTLQANGLALVSSGESFRVLPYEKAKHFGPMIQKRSVPGYAVQAIPLQFISASEMKNILGSVVSKGALLRVDEKRNLLLLAGTGNELKNWLDIVNLFDVDWLKGQSVGFFPLVNGNTEAIISEVKAILQLSSSKQNEAMVKLMPLERMNAVMAISPRKHYIDKIGTWINRLDVPSTYPGKGLFVYKVQNRRAGELADVINEVFTQQEFSNTSQAPSSYFSPETETVNLRSGDTGKEAEKNSPVKTSSSAAMLPAGGLNARLVADEQNNAIIVLSSQEEFQIIKAALTKLDTLPLQVIIEATIVDVILTDDLKYGIEWFFKNSANGYLGQGDLNFGATIAQGSTGFSYSLVDSDGLVRAVLNTLAKEQKINVISSPSLMVLDNNTAEIQVGNQQPVRTATAETDAGTVLETIEFKDTGVRLEVTPSVNPGGLVTMQVSQEVTDIGEIDEATGQRSFLKREVKSTVAVKNGQTIVLGGLITENDTVSESGIPVLYKLPVLGSLFGSTTNSNTRNELLILLTPKVLEKPVDADFILKVFQESMTNLNKDWILH
jgi:general secretion pathway protein D